MFKKKVSSRSYHERTMNKIRLNITLQDVKADLFCKLLNYKSDFTGCTIKNDMHGKNSQCLTDIKGIGVLYSGDEYLRHLRKIEVQSFWCCWAKSVRVQSYVRTFFFVVGKEINILNRE